MLIIPGNNPDSDDGGRKVVISGGSSDVVEVVDVDVADAISNVVVPSVVVASVCVGNAPGKVVTVRDRCVSRRAPGTEVQI